MSCEALSEEAVACSTNLVAHAVDRACMWTVRAVSLTNSCEVEPSVRAEVHSLAASAYLDLGQLPQALAAIQEAITEIDCLRAPAVNYGCRLNLAYYQIKSRRPAEAKAILENLPRLGIKILDLRRRGLRAAALIAAGDNYEAANLQFSELIEEYSQMQMAHDAATLMLYRGEALIRLGHLEQGRSEVVNANKIFDRLNSEESTKQAFVQMMRWAYHMAADELIAGIRQQADLLGGCLPSSSVGPGLPGNSSPDSQR